jgi:DegV family protein with EDD domain
MPPVAIVTDTTCYLPAEMVKAHDIHVVSLYVVFGSDRTEPEAELMLRLDELYDEIRSADQWPTTSQPSVGDFVSVYEPLLAEGRDIVSVHISAGLPSGTCNAARQAAQTLEAEGKGGERIRVIDSTTAAGGLGMLALVAAKRAQAGASADEIEETVTKVRAELKVWFAVDTLEFLKRSGRVGAASAWIGSTLKIKPILTVESEITPVERVRTASRAFERMVEYAGERKQSGADGWVVQHIQSPDQAARLAERCREVFDGKDPLFVSEVGPVLGVHTGPGLLGVGGAPAHFFA